MKMNIFICLMPGNSTVFKDSDDENDAGAPTTSVK
jgi:hypothetical protein